MHFSEACTSKCRQGSDIYIHTHNHIYIQVFLESVHLEMRAGRRRAAISLAQKALKTHTGTGRLWAILIRLTTSDNEKLRMFQRAYREVPKSGEVWCEGARMCLNPLSPLFDLSKARQCLQFAVRFTPQYGDSFIELLRLELLEKGLENTDIEALERLCVNSEPNYGVMWFMCKQHPLDGTRQVHIHVFAHSYIYIYIYI